MNKWYFENIEEFEKLYYMQPYSKDKDGNVIPYEPLKTIIPEIYGEILQRDNGDLYTTKAQRTGCSMCGFGIHLEKRPHRFDKLRESNMAEWRFWMYNCAVNKETGVKFREVLYVHNSKRGNKRKSVMV